MSVTQTVYHAGIPVDLAAPSRQQIGASQFFYGDNRSHVFTALVGDTDHPEAGLRSGAVTGAVLRKDGTTVVLAGEKGAATVPTVYPNGKAANATACSVTLPQECFAVPGPILITIKLVDGETVTSVLNIGGTVIRTETDSAVDPGEIIPDVSTLAASARAALAAAEEANTAAAAADDAATDAEAVVGRVDAAITDAESAAESAYAAVDDATAAATEAYDKAQAANTAAQAANTAATAAGTAATAADTAADNADDAARRANAANVIATGAAQLAQTAAGDANTAASDANAATSAATTAASGADTAASSANTAATSATTAADAANEAADFALDATNQATYAASQANQAASTANTAATRADTAAQAANTAASEANTAAESAAAAGMIRPVEMQGENQYIPIGTAGQTLASPAANPGYQYAVIPCRPGDEFLMESLQTDSGTRVWCFADANRSIIRATNGSIVARQYITAPANSAFFVVNNKYGDGTVYQGYQGRGDNPTRAYGTMIPMRHMGAAGNTYFNGNVSQIDFCSTYTYSGTMGISLIPCAPGDVFTISARGGTYPRAYVFTQKDGTVVQAASADANLMNEQVIAPANAAYLLIQDADSRASYFGPPSALPASKSVVDTIGTDLDAVEADLEELHDELFNTPITGWITGAGWINTGIADLTQPVDLDHTYTGLDYRYIVLDCAPGDSFILNIQGGGYPRAWAFLDSGNYILERADASVGLSNQVIIAPANAAKLVLNDSSGQTSYYGTKSISYRVGELEEQGAAPGKLIGKIMVNFGDSVFGRGQGDTGISGRLAYKTGATVHNLAMSGTSFSTRSGIPGYDAFNLWHMADAITSGDYTAQEAAIAQYTDRPGQAADVIAFLQTFDFSTVDYATIALGTNDWGGNQPLDNQENPNDKGTVCGALRYSLETLLSAFPKTLFVIVSTIPRFDVNGSTYTDKGPNGAGYTLQDMNEALRSVAEEYHLKFIDDFNIGFNRWTCPQYYASGDGTHPDIPGFEVIAENISANL